RVAQLVPVIAAGNSRLAAELLGQPFGGPAVFFISRALVERDQGPARKDVVDIELFDVVPREAAIRANLPIEKAHDMPGPGTLGIDGIERQRAAIDAPVLIAPVTALIVRVAACIGIEKTVEHHHARSWLLQSSGQPMRRMIG